ncbi:hypothetical protein NUSPORA_01131 [Nucleospora cyclopteri]
MSSKNSTTINLTIIKTTVEKSKINVLYINPKHKDLIDNGYALVNGEFLFAVMEDKNVLAGQIACNGPQRAFINAMIGDTIKLEKYEGEREKITSLKTNIDIVGIHKTVLDGIEFTDSFKTANENFPLNPGQMLFYAYEGSIFKLTIIELSVKKFGIIDQSTEMFISTSSSKVQLTNATVDASLMRPSFSFEKLEIGGLKKEFEKMFRRAFVQRLYDPETIKKLGIPHVKGIMLYGPPGTGKTLIARKLGGLLGAKPPKVVNGPEVLSKYVGQSEENIRTLFADAEQEYKTKGEKSSLHIIIFDEIDAICKKRGSDNSGVGDKVVNQLLSKIDGVEALNNILVIGMTNRLDLIDEALLRPGRFEIHLEISLPEENARLEIFQIHTKQMTGNNFLAGDINLKKLAEMSKNYTGAEIAAVVRAACSYALERNVAENEQQLTVTAGDAVKISMEDMKRALTEIIPAFGIDEQQNFALNKVIYETDQFDSIIEKGKDFIKKLQATNLYKTSSLLLYGSTGVGKSFLALRIARSSLFPFIKIISPKDLVGFSEYEKVNFIKEKFSDAYKSEESIVILDEIESLIEFVSIGPRFSNNILQAIKIFIKNEPLSRKTNKIFVIGTTAIPEILDECGITDCFTETTEVQKCNKQDWEKLKQQNEEFSKTEFTGEITIKRLISLLPEADYKN